MKSFWALIALVLAAQVRGRGLKAPKLGALDTGSVLRSKQLQAENDELRKKNDDLESMLQTARTEVMRMDSAAAATRKQFQNNMCTCNEAAVLKQEIQDLKDKMKVTESEKVDLVSTLRRMMTKNSTQIFQKQAEMSNERSMELEMKVANQRQTYEAQIKDINSKCGQTNDQMKLLKDDNAELFQKLHDTEAELAKVSDTEMAECRKSNQDLVANKEYLVSEMQNLMRENTKFKEGLEKESDREKRQAEELAAEAKKELEVEAKLAKVQPAKEQPVKVVSKPMKNPFLAHSKHNDAETATDHAHLRAMNKYMDSVETPEVPESLDSGAASLEDVEQIKALQKEEDLVEKGEVSKNLGDWLGLKHKEPEKTAPTPQQVTRKAMKNDEDAETLLRDAKAQLEGDDEPVPYDP